MGAAHFSGMLLSPLGLGLLLMVVIGISSVHYGPGRSRAPLIHPRRLVLGYVFAVLACAVACAALSYVSPEEAMQRWKVLPEKYWGAQLELFFVNLSIGLYATLLGIAAIGLPIIMFLGRRGQASIPVVLLAAAIVSLALAGVMASGDPPRFATS